MSRIYGQRFRADGRNPMTEHSPKLDQLHAASTGTVALYDDEKGEKTVLVHRHTGPRCLC